MTSGGDDGIRSGLLTLSSRSFGTTDQGLEVDAYTLARAGGIEVSILTYGGIIQSIQVPDRAGHVANVVLGFSDISGYLAAGNTYLGAIVGRYANRIARGCFVLEGRAHRLSRNEGENHLHGGRSGFDKKVWRARPCVSEDEVAVTLSHTSPAGDEGYPGELEVEVSYSLTLENALRIHYRAVTTEATVVSLTNHSLFNLAGEGTGSVLEHELEINAESYTPTDAALVPTGDLASVEGTPMDFRRSAPIGARIGEPFEQLALAGGYDHNFVLAGRVSQSPATHLVHVESGRNLEIRTTEPGIQLYTGNRLDGTIVGASGRVYQRFAGVALETQRFPDSPNNSQFPTSALRPGEVFESTTEMAFSAGPRGSSNGDFVARERR